MVRPSFFECGPWSNKNPTSREIIVFDYETGWPSGHDGSDVVDRKGDVIRKNLPYEVLLMEELKDFESTDVKEGPKDTTMDGKVTAKWLTTWREHITTTTKDQKTADERLVKLATSMAGFNRPGSIDDKIVVIQYETNDGKYSGEEKCTYFENPHEKSKLGRIIKKYGGLKVGMKVAIDFDGKGYTSIRLDKLGA
jgi:hypothetical protein